MIFALHSDYNLFWLRIKKLVYCLFRPKLWPFATQSCFPSVEHFDIARYAISSSVDCFIDVGANIGQFSLLLFSINSSIIVHAFEPIPSCFYKLNHLSRHMKNLTCHNVALGSCHTAKKFYIASSVDSSSFFEPTSSQTAIFGTVLANKCMFVQQTSLNHFLHAATFRRGFLKIDVQGYELNVLRGCDNLVNFFEYIYVELSFIELYKEQPLFSEVHNFLEECGYQLVDIKNLCHSSSGGLVQGDFLFKRVDRSY